MQRKSFLQLAIWASWSQHLLAQTSFQLALKAFWLAELISQLFLYSNCSKNITCLSGKLKTKFTSPIAKSTSPGLSDTTFFARSNWVFSKCEGQASSVDYMYIRKVKGKVLRCFEFVRTDWPDHSHCNAISTFFKTIQPDQSNPK